jgi:hypothetical protein
MTWTADDEADLQRMTMRKQRYKSEARNLTRSMLVRTVEKLDIYELDRVLDAMTEYPEAFIEHATMLKEVK